MKQTTMGFFGKSRKEHGGSLLKGKRKEARPLSTKHPIHLILKSTGNSFFYPSNRALDKLIRESAHKYNIKIYDLALNWSHIHAVILIPPREAYKFFIKTLTSLIVELVSKQKGRDLSKIFDLRPYTRIISWGREFKKVLEYIIQNQLEALGLISRKKKKPRSGKAPGKTSSA
jgi:REP element-mobilizing transposase RayT